MRIFLITILAFFAVSEVFAQFPSTGNYYYIYKYEYSEKDGVNIQRPRSQSDYYMLFVHNGEIVYTMFSQSSLDSEGATLINEKKDEVRYFFGSKQNRYFYDHSLSDSKNFVYTPSSVAVGYSFVVSKDLNSLIEWCRSGDYSNGHFARVLESDLIRPKTKPRFFDD